MPPQSYVPWAKGFLPPSKTAIEAAVGSFPCRHTNDAHRKARLGEAGDETLDQLNIQKLFVPKSGIAALKRPVDPNDWLANNAEEGQSFDSYITELSLRSGRPRPHTRMSRTGGILLVPILCMEQEWPEAAPPLEEIRKFVETFFSGVPVRLSRPAKIKKSTRKTQMEWNPPSTSSGPCRWVYARQHASPDNSGLERVQVNAESLLTCLSDMTDSSSEEGLPFCVVGITFADMYSTPSDLFIAGLAAGRSHVAVLSLFRYHPHIQMSPQHWWKYGFSRNPKTYSYFEDDECHVEFLRDGVPISSQDPPTASRKRKRRLELMLDLPRAPMTRQCRRESLRRVCKLIAHEIMHIYGLDHCIYKRCLMNGTGHLVEDFSAPAHLCGTDLRKLHFRLGFDIPARYGNLARLWKSWGCIKEAKWYAKRQQEAISILKKVAIHQSD
jgi:predicted Zn-dependent protease